MKNMNDKENPTFDIIRHLRMVQKPKRTRRHKVVNEEDMELAGRGNARVQEGMGKVNDLVNNSGSRFMKLMEYLEIKTKG